MKKILFTILLIIIITLRINANTNSDFNERVYILDNINLYSKNIDNVLSDLDIYMISLEINIKNITKVYNVNTRINSSVEKYITKKIESELKSEGNYELASIILSKGYIVNKITIRTSKNTLDIIKSRL